MTTSDSIQLLSDPKIKQFAEELETISKISETLSLEEQRKLHVSLFISAKTVFENIDKVENLEILGGDQNKIGLRIFHPQVNTPLPVLLYFHGGGWVFGSIEESDPVCRRLANYLNCIVVSVEYRLAPENPFPKPLEDCYAATEWVAKNASSFGGDPKHIIVSGESAGGNLAAVVAMMARDKNGPSLSAQLLIYPVISSTLDETVYDRCADQFFITKETMAFFWDMYLQSARSDKNPYFSPDLAADLTGLPPALVITAEYDPLCQEGEKYAELLRRAGVQVISKRFPGLIHGFVYIPLYDPQQKTTWTIEMGNCFRELQSLAF
jgi:acetyl esterase/lipase